MPTLAVEKFIERITKGKPVPGVLLLGSDAYLRDLCRTRLVEACVPADARDWGVSRFSAAADSLDRILARAQTLPMLTPRQVVFVEDVDAWQGRGGKAPPGDSNEDSAGKELAAYLDDPPPFSFPLRETATLDKPL